MNTKNAKVVTISTLVFFGIFILYVGGVIYFYPGLVTEARFQDFFAGITALFSGLAFLGLVGAILLQKDELSLQRKELELTRKELQRTAKAQEKSEAALSKQAESLKVTAKLSGLSAILQHYNTLIETTNSAKMGIDHIQFATHKQKADKVMADIQNLIAGK